MQQGTKVLKIGTELIINDGDFIKDKCSFKSKEYMYMWAPVCVMILWYI